MNTNLAWWNMEPEEIAGRLHSDLNLGLHKPAVKRKQRQEGLNLLEAEERISPFKIWWGQFTDTMVLVLLAGALLSLLVGAVSDAVTIMIIVLLNAILGFVQEYRAERSLAEINKLTAPTCRVMREGETAEIEAGDLVRGDIVLLQAGDKIPADLRVIEAFGLTLDESALTGESVGVEKRRERIEHKELILAESPNLAFMGTVVTRGSGRGIVIATGMDTAIGGIARIIKSSKQGMTPLQKRLAQLGNVLIVICILVCMVVAGLGLYRGEEVLTMLLAGISLAVAAIPEGLPAIVTVALALGVQRMAKNRAIVRKLPAVETLGCTTVICSDKTGTLTKNQMTVKRIAGWNDILAVTGDGFQLKGDFLDSSAHKINPEQTAFKLLLAVAYHCNNAQLKEVKGKVQVQGDPTEGALLVLQAKSRQKISGNRVFELPFDSERKLMSVVVQQPDGYYLYTKGALDVLLNRSKYCLSGDRVVPLTFKQQEYFENLQAKWGEEALRVLSFAYRRLEPQEWLKPDIQLEKDLILVGISGMIDPPREESAGAIQIAQTAGIVPVMITGDHPSTARAIAVQIGIHSAPGVITGSEIDAMSDEKLAGAALSERVFARVSPAHKNRIVKVLQANRQVVAMTGDGVNDAPAVKSADIGIAMGGSGTQVTKEAASMILLDDNFHTIVQAVKAGRGIYDNIRKFIRYLLGCNIGEVLLMFFASLLGMPLPMIPIQILWVNLVTDGLPALALGMEEPEPGIMQRPPRPKSESIFAKGLGRTIFLRGLYIALVSMFIFAVGIVYSRLVGLAGYDLARTMAVTSLVFCQLFYVFECRSERLSPFQLGFFSNKYLILAVLFSVSMQLSLIYLPFLQEIFSTVPLNFWQWSLILFLAGIKFFWGFLKYTLVPGRRWIGDEMV